MTNLIHRLEAAEGPSRDLDAQIDLAIRHPNYRFPEEVLNRKPADYQEALERLEHDGFGGGRIAPRYTASLDAAVSLVPEGIAWAVQMPGQRTTKGARAFADTWPIGMREDINPGVFAATPALALCIAALKAREIS